MQHIKLLSIARNLISYSEIAKDTSLALSTDLECSSSQHLRSDAESQWSFVGRVFHNQAEGKSYLLGRHDTSMAVLKALHGNSKLYRLLRINLCVEYHEKK